MFHNWLHLVTTEPPVPNEETMYYRIEAQRAVLALFRTARESKRLTRQKLSDTKLEKKLTRHFEQFSTHLEIARAIPVEYQIIDFSEHRLDTIHDMHTISQHLGELAVRKTNTRVRDVIRPLVA